MAIGSNLIFVWFLLPFVSNKNDLYLITYINKLVWGMMQCCGAYA
jgi:hypothetical protein